MNLKNKNNKNVRELMQSISSKLRESHSSTPVLDASLILMRWLGFSRTELYTKDDYIPDDNEMRKIEYWTLKRYEGCPMAYLLGKADFMGLSIKVQESTLIPRPETELLTEKVLEAAKSRGYRKGLDMGCGSGAIAISLCHYDPDLEMTASDISERALLIADQNVRDHKANVRLVHSDLFENIRESFDFIVSNPPYIRSDDIPFLEKDVKNYEPLSALDGGKDGLFFYREIINAAASHINKNGLLAFETGYDEGEAVRELMSGAGYRDIEIFKDLAGLDRVVMGYK